MDNNFQYGMDYQGGGGGGDGGGGFSQGGGGGGFSQGGGGGFSQGAGGSNKKGRRNYDEQTVQPCTIAMALQATEDADGSLSLPDGRKLFHIQLVGAVRSVEDFSTNVVYNLEDGTGLLEVKQWLDENDCSAVSEMRQQTLLPNIYLKVIGQIKSYDGKRSMIADSVRPLSTGNELTYHMLSVVYAGEQDKRRNQAVGQATSSMMGSGIGFGAGPVRSVGAPLASSAAGGGGLRDDIINYVKNEGDQFESGISVEGVMRHLGGQQDEGAVHKILADLAAEGMVYSTIDENHFKAAGF